MLVVETKSLKLVESEFRVCKCGGRVGLGACIVERLVVAGETEL